MIEQTLAGVKDRLSSKTIGGFLYGSARTSPAANHDIDIVIVCEECDKQRIRQELGLLQSSVDILIHPLIVGPEELLGNLTLQSMVDGARRLW